MLQLRTFLPALTLILCCASVTSFAQYRNELEQRNLTIAERVEVQRAIERLYNRHQIGVAKSNDEAAQDEVREKHVRIHLQYSMPLDGEL